VGTIPVDVRRLGVDILVGGVLKWLCGGPGGAFLWVRPMLHKRLQPKITGWMAHQQPFAFEPMMRYRKDVFRFLNGTPSIPSLYAAREGPRIIGNIGIGKIREKSKRQTALLIAMAQEYGFSISTPLDPEQRGGTVTLNVPYAYEVSRELLNRQIIVDYREGAGIRLAPHFYNSDEEVVFAVEQIKSILDTKVYKKHSHIRSRVT
jgi:kynureninase